MTEDNFHCFYVNETNKKTIGLKRCDITLYEVLAIKSHSSGQEYVCNTSQRVLCKIRQSIWLSCN